jgi:hypothetical protein
MTVLRRWPGEYHRPPAPVVELNEDDFDGSSSLILDETVRNLKVLREHSHSSEEEARYQFKAISDLTESVKRLESNQAKLVTSLKLKMSKVQAEDFQKALSEAVAKKVDGIFKLVAALGVGFGIILAVIGWGKH